MWVQCLGQTFREVIGLDVPHTQYHGQESEGCAEPTPGEHPNGPQERLVGVADAVVEGESRTQQRGGQTDNQAQDNHQMQSFSGGR